MRKSDSMVYSLSTKMIIFLFFYYFLILLSGMFFSIYLVFFISENSDKMKILMYSFFVSFAVSGMLCSVQYLKRLYKACIGGRINLDDDILKEVGNLVYFLSRPFFSFVFDIIMIFVVLSGMGIVVGGLDYILNEKFLYLCVVLSSFIGFSIGKLLDKFEILSNEKIENIKLGRKEDKLETEH